MELDSSHHYFFDHLDGEEDFYTSTAAPSEDIWKKFQLLPTPPMSPPASLARAPPPSSWVSRVLEEEEPPGLLGNLSAHIIQDCMWSCSSASKQLERLNGRSAHLPPLATFRPLKPQAPPPTSAPPAAACVDPAAILTVPATGCRKVASSGSKSRSDSSDDDDDDDDDEEEIDVVTVEKQQNRVRLLKIRQPVTIRVLADQRFHTSVHRQQHNYAAPSPDSDEDAGEDEEGEQKGEEPGRKRTCSGSSSPSSRPASPSESLQSSDSEDVDRRRNHNFLERKRRNDLRSRFQALRDQIPGLEDTRTPKVAVLTRAAEYLAVLHERHKRQIQEKKRLKTRQQQLLRRLARLQRS